MPATGSQTLDVSGLSVEFRTAERVVRAVRDVSFTLARGETIAIVGESGSGKSVTALSIMRLIEHGGGHIVSGRIDFARDTGAMLDLASADAATMREIRGAEIAMIFQEPMTSLNPVYTAGEQIAEQIQAHENVSKQAARARAIELLAAVGIPQPNHRVDNYPHEFSGGMRQRVMIAMAVSCHPDILIADEPTTALDVTIQAQILDLMRELRDTLGTAIILITHDMGVVAENADRVVVMYAGQIVEVRSSALLHGDPLHPYTAALAAARPDIDQTSRRLLAIPGRPLSAFEAPPGECAFAPRCPHVADECRDGVPDIVDLDGGRSRCVRARELRGRLGVAPDG